MKILHLLQNSLPQISGSTIRTKYIFKYQKKFSKIIAHTSYLFEKSSYDFEIIERVPYYRINKKLSTFFRFYRKIIINFNSLIYLFFGIDIENKLQDFIISLYSRNYINKLVDYYKVDIIHGHSVYLAVKYGLKIAKKKKIPLIYEVRGFIEENILANAYMKAVNKKLLMYNHHSVKKNETLLMKNADLIITLSDFMKNEIIQRGIDSSKIRIIPNGTDVHQLKPIETDIELIKELELDGHFILGFIGRMIWYEGINILLKAIPSIVKQHQKIKILLIGKIENDYLKYLKNIIDDLKISKYVLFIGPIPHKDISRYYSIIDLIVLPRLNFKVGRLVTPLKPLESMAFKRLVIASDFPAFRYTIIPHKTGDLFTAEDSEDLALKILYYINNPEEKLKIENYARHYVEENFNWEKIVANYENIYKELINRKEIPKKSDIECI